MAEELFDELVVASLQAPTYVRDFPVDTSPLTRDHRETPGLTEKWDLYIGGYETATAYSELVDPIVQRERFVEQARYAGLGDAEAMKLDEDFLRAMEYGMPPSGGMGMGVDRLIMALTGLGIRETILSPLSAPPTELTTASGAIAGYQQYGKDVFTCFSGLLHRVGKASGGACHGERNLRNRVLGDARRHVPICIMGLRPYAANNRKCSAAVGTANG